MLEALQKAVLELQDLFFYVGSLVDRQHEFLTTIEDRTNATEMYTGMQLEHLEQAQLSQESYEAKRAAMTGGW